ncbi:MAG: TlpA disulfide reductase family protein [Rikenellaceae bacterium]
MKRAILSCAAIAALAVSCTQAPGSYHVTGSVTNSELEGSTIYLSEYGNKVKLDSAMVESGKFEMKGQLPAPAILFVESGKQRATVLTGDAATITIGDEITSEQNAELEAINEMSASLKQTYNAFMEFAREHRADQEAQNAEHTKTRAKMSEIQNSYLVANADNLVGAYAVLEQVGDTKTIEQLDSLVALAPLSADLYSVQKNRKSKEQALKTAVGQPYIDFSGSNIDGTPAKFSDYVGQGSYVLVDFWASWCGPCRREMPNLREVYEKHKENGLVLLGVNVWDEKEACIKAMDEEEMTWPILYASDDTSATDTYGIRGIPTIILFAPDGTIVDRTARGAAIMELVDGVFAE